MPDTFVNPHHPDALTTDTIRPGTYFACWPVEGDGPAKYYTAASTPYQDDEGYLVIQAQDRHGRKFELSTSEIGLTPCAYDGKWIAIAINMDSTEPPG